LPVAKGLGFAVLPKSVVDTFEYKKDLAIMPSINLGIQIEVQKIFRFLF
jgi:hypothetical protein